MKQHTISPRIRFSRLWAVLILTGFFFTAHGFAHAAPIELAGVKIEDNVSLAGKSLVLNGAGIRYKAVFKVYTAGLYVEKKANTPDGVLDQPGPKRMTITMLREIDSAELGKLFSRGIEDNMEKGSFSKLIPGVMRMSQVFSNHKVLKPGETFTIDWVPGTGTVLTVMGKVEGEPFIEDAFFEALMRIWLGPKSAHCRLKESLLGGK